MYEGALLSGFFDAGPIKHACVRMAEEGGDIMTDLVRENTPVESGHLRDSIHKKLMVVYVDFARGVVYESGCETNIEYAPYIEHGWGLFGEFHRRYLIRPRHPGGWLTWIDPKTGKRIFARKVMHPGSWGRHMFAIGAALTEAEFEIWSRPYLAEWARTQPENHTFVRIQGRL